MASERKKSADPKQRYRRQMRRGKTLAASDRPEDALIAFARALESAEALVETNDDDLMLKRDVARIHQAIGQQARKAGDLDAALAAHRQCHDLVTELVLLDSDNPQRQHNLTLSHAELRDTLRAKGDIRLAIAAGRLAAVCAENVVTLFDDPDGIWHAELMQQRLQLARLLKDDVANATERVRQLDLACAAGEWLVRRSKSEPHRDDIKRGFLDLADVLRQMRRFDDALSVLARFKRVAEVWVARRRNDTGRYTLFGLTQYLTGLVQDMKGEGQAALETYLGGLEYLDLMPEDGYLSESVQLQRGRFFGQAFTLCRSLGNDAMHERFRVLMLGRLQAIAESAPQKIELQQRVMSVSDDLARTLLSMKQPEASLDAARFAKSVLDARATGEDDAPLIMRWRAFLTAEEGRALRHLHRYVEAAAAFGNALVLNEALAELNPGDVRAQCDIAFVSWQLALTDATRRAESLRRSRAILRFLDRTGRLPPYAKAWLPDIERDSRVA
jgi:tetratricopeptide (TPR) repeat protein